jgi:hypothetical protein
VPFKCNLYRYTAARRLAAAAVLAHVPAGDVIARAGNLVGLEDGALFAIARVRVGVHHHLSPRYYCASCLGSEGQTGAMISPSS